MKMKKPAQNEKNCRPKRTAASKVQTYSLLQSGYYNEQRDLKRALKCSLIEAAQIKQKNLEISKKKETPNGKKVKDNSSPAGKAEPKADAKAAKDNPIKDEKPNKEIVANGKPSVDIKLNADIKPTTNGETVAKQRFAAHRKFAQNCQPFAVNAKPVDFKEKQSTTTTKLSAAVKQPPAPLNTDLFSNVKLSTDEFLTFLCFRDCVSLPFSLTDKDLHADSTKFETRKENADLLGDKESTASSSKTRETFKENSKKKLNGSKIKPGDVKEESKVNGKAGKLNSSKSNGTGKSPSKLANGKLNGKLTAAKLAQLKSQLKSGPAKVSQMKSQKLTKLAKLNKAKSVDKKAEQSLKLGKKKVDIKVEPSASKSPDSKPTSKPAITSETIKNLLKNLPKEPIKKKPAQLKAAGKTKVEPKAEKANLFKLPEKPKKEFAKPKKEEVKAKKKFLNTRQLRNGSIHHYKGKQ